MTTESATSEKTEIFRGHVKECLIHLGKTIANVHPKGSRGARKARQPIADYCGVSEATVLLWFDPKRVLPVGEIALRLYCYLDVLGYRVIEFERMPKVQRNFAELIGFRVINGQEAAACLGYSHVSTLFVVLQGKKGAGSDKDQKMWELWKQHRGNLDERRKHTAEIYRLVLTKPARKVTSLKPKRSAAPATAPAPVVVKQSGNLNYKVALSMLEGVSALFQQGALAKVTVEEMVELKFDPNTILILQGHLLALSTRLFKLPQEKV